MDFPVYVVFILAALCFETGLTQIKCVDEAKGSGTITDEVKVYRFRKVEKCWQIKVPAEKKALVKVTKLTVDIERDNEVRLTVGQRTVNVKDFEEFTALAVRETKVTFYVENIRYPYPIVANLELNYEIVSLSCDEPGAFRCTETECVHESQRCNGVKVCSNGNDEKNCGGSTVLPTDAPGIITNAPGITTSSPTEDSDCADIKGLKDSREKTVEKLNDMKFTSTGDWEEDTPKALTAIHLASNTNFDEITGYKLALHIFKNIEGARRSKHQLGMYINAVLATCGDPDSYNSLELLDDLDKARGDSPETSDNGLPFLAKCVSGKYLEDPDINEMKQKLVEQLKTEQDLEIGYYNAMGLACAAKQGHASASEALDTVTKEIVKLQRGDGSFKMDAKTTALYTQILRASNKTTGWNFPNAVKYLMGKMETSKPDFDLITFTLPVLGCNTMLDIRCNKEISRGTVLKENESATTLSLRYGDYKIFSLEVETKRNISALEFLEFAAIQEPMMRFRFTEDKRKLFELAGIADDPTTGYFWEIYYTKSDPNTDTNFVKDDDKYEETKMEEALDEFTMIDVKELILWYKV